VLWSRYFIKLLFYKPRISGFSKHLWENLVKEMFMSPFVSENIYKSLTPFFETLFNFPMAWSLLNTCSNIVSSNARLDANDWPCMVSWLCVTCMNLIEFLMCSYDLQVGLWPNLSKTYQLYNGQWGYAYKYFQLIFQIKPF
jgi:hypothetical protein